MFVDNLTDNRVYLMACKDEYVATVDTDLNIQIWGLKEQQVFISDILITKNIFTLRDFIILII